MNEPAGIPPLPRSRDVYAVASNGRCVRDVDTERATRSLSLHERAAAISAPGLELSQTCCSTSALYRTRDSEMLPVEATGFEVQDSSLAWGCKSDCQERRPMSVANPRRSEPLFDVTEVRPRALFLHRPVVATVRRGCVLVVRRSRRSLQPAASLSFERSRETPTVFSCLRGAH